MLNLYLKFFITVIDAQNRKKKWEEYVGSVGIFYSQFLIKLRYINRYK